MNTDRNMSKKPLVSAILLESDNGQGKIYTDLEAGQEGRDILVHIGGLISSPWVHTLCFCEGPNRNIIATASLGKQADLEEMPLVQLILFINATMLTVEQRYNQHRETLRGTPH